MVKTIKYPGVKWNQFALIYGILLGDGCISKVGKKHYFISVVGDLKKEVEFYSEVIIPILEKITHKKIKLRMSEKQRKLEIVISNKQFYIYLVNIGFPSGKKGNKLMISNIFSIKDYKSLVQGYFATDGSLVLCNNNGLLYPRIEFCSISRPLLIQVYNYLTNLGMKGYLYEKTTYPEKNQQRQFRLQFNGKPNLNIFKKKIGFVNNKHKLRYEYYLKNKKCAGGEI